MLASLTRGRSILDVRVLFCGISIDGIEVSETKPKAEDEFDLGRSMTGVSNSTANESDP